MNTGRFIAPSMDKRTAVMLVGRADSLGIIATGQYGGVKCEVNVTLDLEKAREMCTYLTKMFATEGALPPKPLNTVVSESGGSDLDTEFSEILKKLKEGKNDTGGGV